MPFLHSCKWFRKMVSRAISDREKNPLIKNDAAHSLWNPSLPCLPASTLGARKEIRNPVPSLWNKTQYVASILTKSKWKCLQGTKTGRRVCGWGLNNLVLDQHSQMDGVTGDTLAHGLKSRRRGAKDRVDNTQFSQIALKLSNLRVSESA